MLSLFGYYWILLTLLRKCTYHVASRMEELVAKKNTYSPVWAFFGLKKDHGNDDESVICLLCRAVVLARGGNTSNLFSHPKVHHAKEHASI